MQLKGNGQEIQMEIIFEDFTTFVRCSSRAETILLIFLVDFFFLFERLYLFLFLFLFRFVFLVDDPSQLGRKVGKTGFIYPCLSRTCTRILDLMFVFSNSGRLHRHFRQSKRCRGKNLPHDVPGKVIP